MKKLIISIVATASLALVAKADVAPLNATSFEDYGDDFSVDKSEDGEYYWSGGDAGSEFLIKALAEGGLGAKSVDRPKYWDGTTPDAKALSIDTDVALSRHVATKDAGAQNIGTGLYFDSMVQFTATDTPPTPTDGDKLIVWLKEIPVEGGQPTYKLCVTAATWDDVGAATRVDYVNTNTEIAVDKDEWHRLTISAVINGDRPEFQVFIDGKIFQEGEVNKFLSLSGFSDENRTTLTSVSFQGKGAIDDLVWTTEDPIAPDTISYSVIVDDTVGSMVAQAKYKYGAGDEVEVGLYEDDEDETADFALAVPADATSVTFIFPEFVEGGSYEIEGGAFVDGVATITVPLPVEGAQINLKVIETVVVAKPFTVNGVAYETLADAISNANGATITVTEDIEPATSFEITTTVTIDLKGKTIKANDNDTAGNGVFWVKTGGVLTLLDSSDEQTGTVDGNGGSGYKMAVWADGGRVVINGGTYVNFNNLPDPNNQYDLIYVKNGGLVEITGGTFKCQTPRWTLNKHNTTEGSFVVTGGRFLGYNPTNFNTDEAVTTWCPDGYVATEGDDGYYTVVRVYAVTVEKDANATVTGLAAKYAAGATVSFTVATEEDYEVTSVTMNGTPLTAANGTYSFEMPAEAVTIVVTTEAVNNEPEYPEVEAEEDEEVTESFSDEAKAVIKDAFTVEGVYTKPSAPLAVEVNGESLKGDAAINMINEVVEKFSGNPFTNGKLELTFKVTDVMKALTGDAQGYNLTVGDAQLRSTYKVVPKYIDLATKVESLTKPTEGAVIFKLSIEPVAADAE